MSNLPLSQKLFQFERIHFQMLKRILFIASAAITLCISGGRAETVVGTLPGDVVVDNTGAATYTIPLSVVPGTAGMQPDLSLQYSSQGGNGVLGVGWSIGGLSAISRAPQTWLDNDGSPGFTPDGIDFDANDRFTLDGQRLICVSGTYGQHLAVYRTEVDSFSRISSWETLGNGPKYFVVETKAGLKMGYGAYFDSALVPANSPDGSALSWALWRTEDSLGNYIDYDYDLDTATGEQTLRSIRYTGNHQVQPEQLTYNKVEFVYRDRSEISSNAERKVYLHGQFVEQTKLLDYISVKEHGEEVWRYEFNYSKSPHSEAIRLMSVQQKVGSQSISETSFQWKDGGTSEFLNQRWITDGGDFIYEHTPLVADFDGDGVSDIAYIFNDDGDVSVDVFVSSGTSFASQRWITKQDEFQDNQSFHVADVNGDGLADIVHILHTDSEYFNSSSFVSNVYLNQEGSFTIQPWMSWWFHNQYIEIASRKWFSGDFNGDGLGDFAYVYKDNFSISVDVYVSDGTTATRQSWLYQASSFPSSSHSEFHLVDANGDGLPDIAHTHGSSQMSIDVMLNDGSSFQHSNWIASTGNFTEHSKWLPSDYNGDGLTDLAYVFRDSGDISIDVYISDGKSYFPQRWETQSGGYLINVNNAEFHAVDANGDGLPDIAYTFGDANNTIDVHLNDGHSFHNQRWTDPAGAYIQSSYWQPSDYSGDGLVEFAYVFKDGSNVSIDVYKNLRERADLLVNVENGFGVETGITYKPLTDDSIYEKGSGAQYPIVDIQAPMYVATTISKDDGAGGQYLSNYTYAAARAHVLGRGFLGFQCFKSHDPQTNLYKIDVLTQDYPTAGMILESSTWYNLGQSNEELLSRTTNTVMFDAVLYGTYFPFMAKSIEEKWEFGQGQVDGNDDPINTPYATVTTRNRFDSQTTFKDSAYDPLDPSTAFLDETSIVYGDIAAIEIDYGSNSQGTPNTQLTENYYYPVSGDWYLGRLALAQVTSTIPDPDNPAVALSETRTSGFKYFSATGLLAEEFTEPANHSQFTAASTIPATPGHEFRTKYTRDAYGNITQTEIFPYGMSSRITETMSDPDSTYRYYQKTTNNLGHEETRTYDTVFGQVTSVTGPNGRTTTWEYDDWGRKIKEIRPDGTESEWSYEFATITVPINDNSGNLVQNHTTKYKVTSTGTQAPTSISYYDKLGRIIQEQTEDYSGLWINRDTGYNTLGQVVCASENYFDQTQTPDKYTKSDYDLLGRIEILTAPDDTKTKTEYNGLTTTVTRNFVSGGMLSSQNQKIITTKNIRGQTVSVWNGESGNLNNKILYQYDPTGNLVKTINPQNDEVIMTYDIQGRKTSMNDPDMGVWTYQYNGLGELVSQIDAKGQVTQMTYDELGRMESRTTDFGGTNPETSYWHYDGTDEYDEIGALRLEVGPDGSRTSYYYDDLGRAFLTLERVRVATGTTKDFKYFYSFSAFDEYSRVVRSSRHWRPVELEDDTFNLHYGWLSFGTFTAYNERSFVTHVKDNTEKYWWSAPVYNAHGQLESYQVGDNLVTSMTYDARDQTLKTIKTGTTSNPTSLQDAAYTFDDLGNLTERKQKLGGGSNPMLVENIVYDRLNRMTSSQVVSGPQLTASYNELGNILTKSGVGSYTYGQNGAGPHAVTTAGTNTYSYDANGNLTQKNSDTITWTSFNKVSEINNGNNASKFTYCANHNRITQIIRENSADKRRKIYAVGLEQDEAIVNGNWQTTKTKIYIGTPGGTVGVHEHLTDYTSNDYYFLKDHLGSVIATVDASNDSIVEQYSFDSWGQRRDYTDWIGAPPQSQDFKTDRGFTGHEMLDEVGLIHMNGRIYDAEIGRMLSADPNIPSASNLQSYNRYSYVLNNPLSYTDPSGFFFKKLFKKIGNFFKKYWKPIVAIVATVVASWAVGWYLITVNSLGLGFHGVNVAIAAVGGAAGGASLSALTGGDIGKGALFGALSAAAAYGIGSALGHLTSDKVIVELARAGAHGVSNGVMGEIQGGRFSAGFLSSSFSSLAGSYLPGGVVSAAIIGGTASTIGGGKFENGAVTSSFVVLFNHGRAGIGKKDRTRQAEQDRDIRQLILNKRATLLRARVEAGELTHREAAAQLADATAAFHVDSKPILFGLARKDDVQGFLTDLAAVGAGINLQLERVPLYVRMGSGGGFPSYLQDGSDQFRHFLGATVTGYRYGRSMGNLLAFGRELGSSPAARTLADFQMNAIGVEAGVRLRSGELKIGDFGEFIRN